jgi:cyclohexanone monooxygenase
MIDEQSRHLAYILQHAMSNGVTVVEASADAEEAWVQTIVELAVNNQRFLEACTPGYYNNEGRPDERTARNSQFWRGPMVFIRLLDAWRRDGHLPGLEVVAEPAAVTAGTAPGT